jgi:3'-phosphoadenosine 5'-phosphosulfate sulfotransferase (PAPS reductase)/FAD synthetase
MDWPITPDYCRAFAETLNLPIYYSWRVGGFEREMLRCDQLTAPCKFETPEGEIKQVGGDRGKPNTRRKFPQVSANLSVRWCSAYTKIMVCDALIINQERFRNKRTLVVTGERAEESSARAKYKIFEPDRSDLRDGKKYQRHVDHYRVVHDWDESKIWEAMERYRINPHPAYKLGWGRLSCMACIFGNKNQWASVKEIDPTRFRKISKYEKEFGCTIHRTKNVAELVQEGKPYANMNILDIHQAMATEYKENMILKKWKLPSGAFGDNTGPS